MNIAELSNEIGIIFSNNSENSFIFPTTTLGLGLFELPEKTEFEAAIYKPIACLILQGEKQISVGGQSVTLGPGESLIIGHDLPVTSRITKADRKTPYRAIIITSILKLSAVFLIRLVKPLSTRTATMFLGSVRQTQH